MLVWKPDTSTDYDPIAERYAANIDGQPWNVLYERPMTLSLLPNVASKNVLDVGCGGGWYSEQLLNRGARVVGIDCSARMVEIAAKRLAGRARVLNADITALGETFANGSFDLILSSLVLHYVADLRAAFTECARVLRPDGVLIFSTHHPFDMEGFGATSRAVTSYLDAQIIEEEWKWLGPMRYWRRPLQAITEPLYQAGLLIERICEPANGEELKTADRKGYVRLRGLPAFIFVRARKLRFREAT